MLDAIKAAIDIPRDKPELAIAQYSAFRRQVPLLYVMLLVSSAMLSATHYSRAPAWLTLIVPVLLTLVCLIRIANWIREGTVAITHERALKQLQGTIRFSIILGIGFATWAFALYAYGDPLHQSHVAFYMAVTIISCMFSIIHLRTAAFLLALIVLLPFSIFFLVSGQPVFQAIAINVIFVTANIVYILNVYYRDFAQLIESRKELQVRQAETQSLLEEKRVLVNLDSLTELYNRRWFAQTLETSLVTVREQGLSLAVGVIDLDGFKPVNDAYGHVAGDKVLIEIGRRLQQFGDANAMDVARLGGDEFGIVMLGHLDQQKVLADVGRLLSDLRMPIYLPEVSARVGASAGLAFYPDGGDVAEVLFEHADYALFNAKQARCGQVVLFNEVMASEVAYRSLVEQELRRADLEREFEVQFQPLWSLGEARTYGFEALARWNSAALGPVRPDVFIPIAEKSGLISKLTEVLFAKAIGHAKAWPDNVALSCNLSAKDVSSEQTLSRLLELLEESAFDPKRLVLELTETAILENVAEAYANLDRMRDLGIGIALDDFGVGQSSLGQVHRLPISKIKIDQSFVVEILTSQVQRNIVRTIVDLAKNIGCRCIVEGVETEAQARMLASLGCDLMQGYHFGRPMSAEAALGRAEAEQREQESSRKHATA